MNRILLISISLIIFLLSISCVSAAGIGSGTDIGGYSDCSGTSIGAAGITFHGGSSDYGAFGPNYGNGNFDFGLSKGFDVKVPDSISSRVL